MPITYSFALIIYIVVIDVAFLHDFYPEAGYIIVLISTILSYGIAIHYKVFKTFLDGVNPKFYLIN